MRMTNKVRRGLMVAAAMSLVAVGTIAPAQSSPDERAEAAVARMTQDEKLQLVFAYFGSDWQGKKPPADSRYGSAGYVPGIPRLHIPPQWETDAGVGVATQGGAATKRERTSLPSGIATAATWNPDIAFQGGRMIGSEATFGGATCAA